MLPLIWKSQTDEGFGLNVLRMCFPGDSIYIYIHIYTIYVYILYAGRYIDFIFAEIPRERQVTYNLRSARLYEQNIQGVSKQLFDV